MTTTRGLLRVLAVGAVVVASLNGTHHLLAQSPSAMLPRMRYEPILPPPQVEPAVSNRVQAQPSEGEVSDTVVLGELKGVLFVDSSSKIKLIAPEIHGIQTETDSSLLLARAPGFLASLEPYLNRALSIGDLRAMQKKIIDYYHCRDMPAVSVIVPNQDTSSGTLQIVILEGRVSQMLFDGNRNSSSCWLRERMDTQPGARICGSRLNEDIRWLNRGGFRDVTMEVTPSPEEGWYDLEFDVAEDFPIRSSLGYSDTGTRTLGIERLQFGVTHGNLFGADRQFSYSYCATPDFERVEVHSYSYMIPFDNRDILSVFGYHGTTVSPMPFPFDSEGAMWQASFRYLKLLDVDSRQRSRRERRLTFGVDFKETNTNLDFGGIQVSNVYPQIAQFAIGYTQSYIHAEGSLAFSTELLWSPGDLTGNNNSAEFQELRYGAPADYVYATGNVGTIRYLGKKLQWNVNAQGQWADARLLPIEMMGLGGEGSVRGFDTYALSGDCGWCVSNELATRYKSLGLHKRLRQTILYRSVRPVEDEFQVFGFFDVGGVWTRSCVSAFLEEPYQSISGTGLGCRYQFGPWIQARAAYGWQVEGLTRSFYDMSDRAHISVTISR